MLADPGDDLVAPCRSKLFWAHACARRLATAGLGSVWLVGIGSTSSTCITGSSDKSASKEMWSPDTVAWAINPSKYPDGALQFPFGGDNHWREIIKRKWDNGHPKHMCPCMPLSQKCLNISVWGKLIGSGNEPDLHNANFQGSDGQGLTYEENVICSVGRVLER